jgi:hypothetical protein
LLQQFIHGLAGGGSRERLRRLRWNSWF